MNKKAHHELGWTPYAIALAFLALIAVFFKKIYRKLKN